jgi:hypothetical protein
MRSTGPSNPPRSCPALIPPLRYLGGCFALVLAGFLTDPVRAESLSVDLLGQQCSLKGPFSSAVLKAIHELSPDRLYPPEFSPEVSDGRDQTRGALDRLKKRGTGTTPAALDRYRERVGRRLEAQLAFYEAWQAARRENKAQLLGERVRRYLSGRGRTEFETQLKRWEGKPGSNLASLFKNNDAATALFVSYNDAIEADPQEDFHRTIEKMGIRYECAFHEAAEESDTDEE